jgi:hypothetical protein
MKNSSEKNENGNKKMFPNIKLFEYNISSAEQFELNGRPVIRKNLNEGESKNIFYSISH